MRDLSIMSVHGPESPVQYYIDVPLDTFSDDMLPAQEVKRMAIPRELALYIDRLQKENRDLKASVKAQRRVTCHT